MSVRLLRRELLSAIFIAGSILPSPGSAADVRRARPTAQEIWARTELYFGTAMPDGVVSDVEFAEFVDWYVTPRFPDGLTLLTGYGQFLSSNGMLVKERSKMLILFYPLHTKAANQMIEEIRAKYKEKFHQESVLRVDSYSAISF